TIPNIQEHFGQGDERLRVFPEKVRQRLYALGRGPREASFQLRRGKICNLESDGEHPAALVISLHNLIQSATDIEGDIRRCKIDDVVGRRCGFCGRGGRARNAFSVRHGASLYRRPGKTAPAAREAPGPSVASPRAGATAGGPAWLGNVVVIAPFPGGQTK